MAGIDWFTPDDPPRHEPPAIDRSTALDQLARPQRALVIRTVAIDGPQIVEDLAAAIASTEPALTEDGARLELRHRHLPALQDAQILVEDQPGRYGPGEHFAAVRALQQRVDRWMQGGETV